MRRKWELFLNGWKGARSTWLQDDPACPAGEWLATFDAVRTRLLAETNGILNGERTISASFYPEAYLKPVEADQAARAGKLVDLRQEGRLTAMVLPDLDNGKISPCGFIRLVLPLDHVAHSCEEITVEQVTFDAALRRIANVLICQRHVVKDIRLADKLIMHCRETGMRLVYDLDDDLITDAKEHPERAYLQRLAPIVLRMLIGSDEVWVSTEELKQRVSGIQPDAIVMPNRLDERLWVEPGAPKLPHNEPVRILYMGTMTHEIDLAFFEGVAERLKHKFGSGVAIEIIGVTAKADLHPSMTRVATPNTASASYPGFVEWMVGQSRWDVGVAPLVDTTFARAKSGIKALDYSALGLPVVASDVEAYRGTLNEQDGVKLVPNDANAWVEALSDLIQDHEKRQELGRRARKAFLSTNSLRATDKQWSIALDHAAGVSGSVTRKFDFNFCEIDKNGLVSISREILAAAFLHGEGIEVGALHNPLRLPGEVRVRYVDRLDVAGLVEHYPELGDLPLVDVDYVDDGELLKSFAAETQDFVIANHFLEHCEDPLTTIANHLRVVRPGGFIYMAVPDKRKTFDKDREITPLSHIIADFEHGGIQSRRRHYEEWVTLVEPYFGRDHKNETKVIIAERIEQLMKQAYSIHFHCWTRSEVIEMLDYAKNVLRYPFEVELVVEREEEIIFILRRKVRG